MNGTDGWIYFGYVKGTVDKPTFKEMKAGTLSNSTNYEKFWYLFVLNGKKVSVSIKSLTMATKYTGIVAGSNQDPIMGAGSDVTLKDFTTTGTTPPGTTFAYNKSVGFFALLTLLFALFILI